MARVHNKLNIPIVWSVPSGLVVNHQYMKQSKKKFRPVWSSVRSLTLTITDNVKIDKNKQKRAWIPQRRIDYGVLADDWEALRSATSRR